MRIGKVCLVVSMVVVLFGVLTSITVNAQDMSIWHGKWFKLTKQEKGIKVIGSSVSHERRKDTWYVKVEDWDPTNKILSGIIIDERSDPNDDWDKRSLQLHYLSGTNTDFTAFIDEEDSNEAGAQAIHCIVKIDGSIAHGELKSARFKTLRGDYWGWSAGEGEYRLGAYTINGKLIPESKVPHDIMIVGCTHDPVNDEHGAWGHPNRLEIPSVPGNETYVAFGIIADTHVDALTCSDSGLFCSSDNYNDSDHMNYNRAVIGDLNLDCVPSGAPHVENRCLGIVHLGDMVNNWSIQQVLAFRQLYEYDYSNNGVYTWGCDCGTTCNDAYSQGSRIHFPVIPMLGNHDVPNSPGGVDTRTGGYIIQRVSGANGLKAEYDKRNFIWRWGQYVFVTLGLWAGSYNYEDQTQTDVNKLNWLRDSLANIVGNSNLGVLIFQHYGWDGFSKGWWTDDQRDMMINILCRRENKNDVCNPYNVLGIFSGHVHNPQKPYLVDAGKDAKGKEVYFENFTMFSAASPDTKHDYCAHGYSVVRLTPNKMYIHTKDKCANKFWVPPTERDISTGPGDPNSFWYSIGWDLQSSGDPGSWSPIIDFRDEPFGGGVPAGGGADIAHIDNDPRPDLVLMGIDNPMGRNSVYYRVGWNLQSDGKASNWSHAKWAASRDIGDETAGGGAAIADIDGKPDLVFMAIDNP